MRKLLLALAVALGSLPIQAAEHWIRVSSPHFEMYTTNGERQATEALKVFEQVRYFFLQRSSSKTAPNDMVRIIAFRSEKEYKPYRPNEGAFAYYLPSRKGDFIVMQDISPNHYQTAVHEYTHLIIEHLGLKFPVFLNEGLAELYSSLESRGDKAMVGRPLEGNSEILRSEKWLDLNTLSAVDQNSPYYNESAKMSIFYAESWALVHMLTLGKNYSASFSKFQSEVQKPQPVSECFRTVYGKSVAEVTKDLRSYVNQSTVQAALFDVKLSKTELEPEVSEPGELSVNLALADLLAAQEKKTEEAGERLAALALAHPESPDVQESIGYLAWSRNDSQKAIESFKLAQEKGSKNEQMLVDYAGLLSNSGAKPQDVLPILQRAVEIKPDDQTAWFNLGMLATAAEKFSAALPAWQHVTNVTPDQAYNLFSAQAYCYLRLKSYEMARSLAERAKTYAKTPQQQLYISRLLENLEHSEQGPQQAKALDMRPEAAAEQPGAVADAPDRPTLRRMAPHELPRDVPTVVWADNLQHVEAVAKKLDCSGKIRRLHVLVNATEMTFELMPEEVIVRNGKQNTVDMQCGSQKPYNVGIFYVPLAQPNSADGSIKEMVF